MIDKDLYHRSLESLDELRFYKNNFAKYKDVESVLAFENIYQALNPLVSFVIPTANRSDTLILSLRSILEQKFDFEIELIIVDNSGDIERSDIIEQLKTADNPWNYYIKYYINKENIGMSGNFNRCFELANGIWVSMLHDDDLLSPDFGDEIFRCLKNKLVNESVALIKTRYIIFSNETQLPLYKNMSRGGLKIINKFDTLLKGSGPTAAPTCGMLIRKEYMMDVGGYCELFYPSMDHILGYQLQRKGYITLETEDVLGFYRIAENASMKVDTFVGFSVQDSVFRLYLYEDNLFFKIIGSIFEPLNYSLMIEKLIAFSKNGLIEGLTIKDIDFKGSYNKHFIRYYIFRIVRKIENVILRDRVHYD